MRVPRHFVSLMQPATPDDPLLLQVLPDRQEFNQAPGFSVDPLAEQNNQTPGMLHKYRSRVLLIVRGGCAVNCRYCFRRHFPYADNAPSKQDWQNILSTIAADPNINEVILSGGDPLMAKDTHLAELAHKISTIPHIKRLRIHTRLPVVLPERLDDAFFNWFSGLPLQRIMVLHINHPQEISPQLILRLKRLADAGVTLLNQAVLLRGINDNAKCLVQLSESLFAAGIMPYYIHLLDKVEGASHFDIPTDAARALMQNIAAELPGYLVPKLVREVGGEQSKSLVDLNMLDE